MNFLSFQNSHFKIIWYKICMDFYLVRWTYSNDVNVGRNILMNSQLKWILFMSSDKKKWNKTEKDRKNVEKENNTHESDFSENEDFEAFEDFFEACWIWTKNKHRRY